ncbi:type III secretion system outer membrane ring subunit SctC [Morganella psychrotolerans]|uniref:Type 3 secretion system secretin n=1 Tax=Morganella psychrotolerans TaxID=368603 RepID=A0A1B8HN41_9GAMM|nr:type III secretion system outer membrane ring subunit SctC [Morganella psychrotolerans]OBU10849.1 EscC/YscC/HrcC family type III secretion system outer membrane ring protein [Morganella psychrotolerans]
MWLKNNTERCGRLFFVFFCLFSLPVAAQQTLLYEKKPPSEEQYVAKETRLDHFFDALAGKLDVMIITSEAVKKKKISGTFDLSDPQAALSLMLKTMALVSYRENRTLYIYNSNEVESSMLSLNTVTRSELTAFLQQTGLFDARYPLKSDRQQQILYITAPPRYMSLIRSAADALEAQYSVQEQGMNPEDEHIQLVKLENSFVQDREITSRGKSQILPGVASALRELLNGGTAAKTGLIPRNEEQAQALPAETVWLGGERIRIVPLQGENSLLLKGNRNALNLINQLIKQLDVAKPQIELSLWILDVSKNEADQLGINWQADYGGGKMKVAFNLSELNQFTGFSFFSKIRALSAKGQANMVSRPIILTQDNTPAVFDNNTTFYTTLLGERVSSLESITYGTKVSVTPRIANQRKSVEMIIELEDGAQKKEIAESNGEGALPVINRTNISTIARVAQGNTLLIGGYTRENTQHHKDKVPLLGDIPLAGRLFQFESVKTEKMVRLFLLQPRILQQDFFSDTEVTGYIPFNN